MVFTHQHRTQVLSFCVIFLEIQASHSCRFSQCGQICLRLKTALTKSSVLMCDNFKNTAHFALPIQPIQKGTKAAKAQICVKIFLHRLNERLGDQILKFCVLM